MDKRHARTNAERNEFIHKHPAQRSPPCPVPRLAIYRLCDESTATAAGGPGTLKVRSAGSVRPQWEARSRQHGAVAARRGAGGGSAGGAGAARPRCSSSADAVTMNPRRGHTGFRALAGRALRQSGPSTARQPAGSSFAPRRRGQRSEARSRRTWEKMSATIGQTFAPHRTAPPCLRGLRLVAQVAERELPELARVPRVAQLTRRASRAPAAAQPNSPAR